MFLRVTAMSDCMAVYKVMAVCMYGCVCMDVYVCVYMYVHKTFVKKRIQSFAKPRYGKV